MFQFQDDYYDILNVNPNSTKKDIVRAYRTLALKWHPDKNKSKNAHHMFVKIAEAYEVLSDPKKKHRYDAYYFNDKPRYKDENFTKTHKKTPENTKNESDKSNKWEFSFKNPFELFNNLFPNLDRKVLNVFGSALSHMKKATDHTFLIKLMDEYKYFTKNKNYKYDDENNFSSDSDTDTNKYNKYSTIFNHNRKRNHRNQEQYQYDEFSHKHKHKKGERDSTYIPSTEQSPPKQVYELEIPLIEYLQQKIKRIQLPMLAKCFTCSIKIREGCHICNGNLYYESTKIYPIPLNETSIYFPEGGNFLPEYNKPCDFIIHCKDKYDKHYKRIGNHHLYLYVFWNGHDVFFRYINGEYYKLNIFNNLNKRMNDKGEKIEPCDFSNNIIRIDNMGLPNLTNHIHTSEKKYTRGDLFICLTQDIDYCLDDNSLGEAIEYLKYHPENDINPSEILNIGTILEHFT